MSIQKILLVDDDKNIRFLAGMSLEDRWQVIPAASGQEALEAVVRDKPDLVLLDMVMPDMDGETTLFSLRRIDGCENLPVIFMTARAQRHEVDSYMSLGVLGVIVKPFDPLTLAEQIERILANGQD